MIVANDCERATSDVLVRTVNLCQQELARRQGMFMKKDAPFQGCEPEAPNEPQGMQNACRLNARGALEELINKREREICHLRALLNTLPMQLSHEADEAVYEIVQAMRCR